MNRRYRLQHKGDFARVRSQGESWANRLLVLAAAPNGLDLSRFGFVASKRVGKAVERNRAKRLMREAVRQSLRALPVGWDCVLIARAPLISATWAEVQEAVGQLFQRASLRSLSSGADEAASSVLGGASFRGEVALT